jgi:hypothetical protein
MFAEASIPQLVGGAAFVRAELFSRWSGTPTTRMGAFLLVHNCHRDLLLNIFL